MDKVPKTITTQCYTPLSKPFRIYTNNGVFSVPKRPDLPWSLPGHCSRGKAAGVKLTPPPNAEIKNGGVLRTFLRTPPPTPPPLYTYTSCTGTTLFYKSV
jgi:hypothetical protein